MTVVRPHVEVTTYRIGDDQPLDVKIPHVHVNGDEWAVTAVTWEARADDVPLITLQFAGTLDVIAQDPPPPSRLYARPGGAE